MTALKDRKCCVFYFILCSDEKMKFENSKLTSENRNAENNL